MSRPVPHTFVTSSSAYTFHLRPPQARRGALVCYCYTFFYYCYTRYFRCTKVAQVIYEIVLRHSNLLRYIYIIPIPLSCNSSIISFIQRQRCHFPSNALCLTSCMTNFNLFLDCTPSYVPPSNVSLATNIVRSTFMATLLFN